MDEKEKLLKTIDDLLQRFPEVEQSWYHSGMEGWFRNTSAYEALMTEVLSLIPHIYGFGHPNSQRVINAYNQQSLKGLKIVKGILEGTKNNIENGLISEITENITIDIKTDFLNSAQEFIENDQKDPAAVLGCVVLEDSLKKLAKKNGIEGMQNKEMSVVANTLLSKKIIDKSTLSSILSFRNLRNAAFHAQWDEISLQSVKLLLTFLPIFINRFKV